MCHSVTWRRGLFLQEAVQLFRYCAGTAKLKTAHFHELSLILGRLDRDGIPNVALALYDATPEAEVLSVCFAALPPATKGG